MTKIAKLQINMGNAAFDGDDAPHELCRIFQEIADKLGEDSEIVTFGGKMTLRDINGNTVGFLKITEE